jgi:replication factor C large subunit
MNSNNDNTSSWVEKHRPSDWKDIQGNNKSVKQIRRWAENWEPGDDPQLLVGPPGVGKTTTAYVAAEELDMPLNKVNVSLTRTSDEIRPVARSIHSSPADDDHQLVLLDEVDNFHHAAKKDKLFDAIRSPRNPIILTANNERDVPSAIKRASETHEFKLGVRSRRAKIREIAEREGLDLSPEEIGKLGERPDLRSAINDLQTMASSGVEIGEDERTWAEGEWSAMDALLSGDDEVWKGSVSYSDETFDGIGGALLWADENLSQEFRGLESGVAYQILASADYWAGIAWERQDFRYRKYGWAMLDLLPEARLSEPYQGYIDVSFPQWFRKSKAKHDGSTDEAELYQSLKGSDRGFKMAGSFFEFKQRVLPILQDLPEDEKLELALNNGMDSGAIEALGLDPDDYDEWREVEAPEQGDGWSPDTNSASEASW